MAAGGTERIPGRSSSLGGGQNHHHAELEIKTISPTERAGKYGG